MARCTCVKCGWNGNPDKLKFNFGEIVINSLQDNNLQILCNKILDKLPKGPLKLETGLFDNNMKHSITKMDFQNKTFDAIYWLAAKLDLINKKTSSFSPEQMKRDVNQIDQALKSDELQWTANGADKKSKTKTIEMYLGHIENALNEELSGIGNGILNIKYFYINSKEEIWSVKTIYDMLCEVEENMDVVKKIIDAGVNGANENVLRNKIGDINEFKTTAKPAIDRHINNIRRMLKDLKYSSVDILISWFDAMNKQRMMQDTNLPQHILDIAEAIKDEEDVKDAINTILRDNELPDELFVFKNMKNIRSDEDGEIKVPSILIDDFKKLDRRYCPECNAQMSKFAGSCPEHILTVIGNQRVSKSTALTAAIHYMQKWGQAVTVETDSDNQDWKAFEEHYLSNYKRNLKVAATETDGAIPQFSLRFRFENGKKCVLTILDIPGEYIKKGLPEAARRLYGKLYNQVDYVWYCMDIPEIEQIFPINNSQNKDILVRSGYMDHGEIKNPVTIDEIIKNMKGSISPAALINQNRKDKVNAMFIITKTDVVQESDNNRYKLYANNTDMDFVKFDRITKTLYLDEREIYTYMSMWRDYINAKRGVEGLVKTFEEKFIQHGYCALSSYGQSGPDSPDSINQKKNIYNSPNGYMTGWPLVWMFILEGYIGVEADIVKQVNKTFWKKTEVTKKIVTVDNDDNVRKNMSMQNKNGEPFYYTHIDAAK